MERKLELKLAQYLTDDADSGLAGVRQRCRQERLSDEDLAHIGWKYAEALSQSAFSVCVHLVQLSDDRPRVLRADIIHFDLEVRAPTL